MQKIGRRCLAAALVLVSLTGCSSGEAPASTSGPSDNAGTIAAEPSAGAPTLLTDAVEIKLPTNAAWTTGGPSGANASDQDFRVFRVDVLSLDLPDGVSTLGDASDVVLNSYRDSFPDVTRGDDRPVDGVAVAAFAGGKDDTNRLSAVMAVRGRTAVLIEFHFDQAFTARDGQDARGMVDDIVANIRWR